MRRGYRIAIGCGLFLLLAVGYVLALTSYKADVSARSAGVQVTTDSGADVITVDARVLSIDPTKTEAVVRLAFTPNGKYVSSTGALSQDLVFTVNGETGNVERTFAKGKIMAPADVTIGLADGQVSDFPFDSYQTELAMFMTEAPAAGAPTADAVPVPLDLGLTASVHGYHIDVNPDPNSSPQLVAVSFGVSRASSTVFFAVFVMVAMWLLALGAVTLAWKILMGGLKPEIPMMTFLSALLFAFPAIRNALPGTPPIGSINDYIAFFWTEGLVAVSLFTVVGCWLIRVARKPATP